MASKEAQIAEFQALFVKAYTIFMEQPDAEPLMKIFADLYNADSTEAEEKVVEEAEQEVAPEAEEEVAPEDEKSTAPEDEKSPAPETDDATLQAAGKSAGAAKNGASSISFGGDASAVNVRSSTRVRQPAGGKSSISFGGGDVEPVKSSTRVRVAPGGRSTLALGGPSLAKDNTRKKKKAEAPKVDLKPIPTPREMAANEAKSNIFGTSPASPTASTHEFSAEGNASILAAVNKYDKLKLAFQEFVGDGSGRLMTPESFTEGCERLGVENVDADYVATLFEAYGKGKGTVGFSGFVRFVNKISS